MHPDVGLDETEIEFGLINREGSDSVPDSKKLNKLLEEHSRQVFCV